MALNSEWSGVLPGQQAQPRKPRRPRPGQDVFDRDYAPVLQMNRLESEILTGINKSRDVIAKIESHAGADDSINFEAFRKESDRRQALINDAEKMEDTCRKHIDFIRQNTIVKKTQMAEVAERLKKTKAVLSAISPKIEAQLDQLLSEQQTFVNDYLQNQLEGIQDSIAANAAALANSDLHRQIGQLESHINHNKEALQTVQKELDRSRKLVEEITNEKTALQAQKDDADYHINLLKNKNRGLGEEKSIAANTIAELREQLLREQSKTQNEAQKAKDLEQRLQLAEIAKSNAETELATLRQAPVPREQLQAHNASWAELMELRAAKVTLLQKLNAEKLITSTVPGYKLTITGLQTQVTTLEESMKSKEAEWMKERTRLEGLYEEVLKSNRNLRSDADACASKITALEESLEAASLNFESKQLEIEQKSGLISEKDNKIRLLLEQLDKSSELDQLRDQWGQEKVDLEKFIYDIKTDKRELVNKLAAKQKELDDMLASKQKELHDMFAKQKELENKLVSQKKELENRLVSNQKELENKLVSNQKELENKLAVEQMELEDKLASKQRELDGKLAAEQMELEDKLMSKQRELDSKLEAKQKELDDMIASNQTELNDQLAAKQKELDDILASNQKELNDKLKAKQKAHEQSFYELSRLKSKDYRTLLEDAQNRNNVKIAETQKLHDQKVHGLEAKIHTLEKTVRANEKAQDRKIADTQKLHDQKVHGLEEKIRTLENNLQQRQVDFERCKEDLEKYKSEFETSQNKVEAYKEALDDLQNTVNAAQGTIQVLTSQTSELVNVRSELVNVRTEMEACKNELEACKNELKTCQFEREDAEREIQMLKERYAKSKEVQDRNTDKLVEDHKKHVANLIEQRDEFEQRAKSARKLSESLTASMKKMESFLDNPTHQENSRLSEQVQDLESQVKDLNSQLAARIQETCPVGDYNRVCEQIQDTRKELQDTRKELQDTREELQDTRKELQDTREGLRLLQMENRNVNNDLATAKEEISQLRGMVQSNAARVREAPYRRSQDVGNLQDGRHSQDVGHLPDAGHSQDVEHLPDAGHSQDVEHLPDAGHSQNVEHSQDAGHLPDAGHSQDAGHLPDAGHSQDVEHLPDAGHSQNVEHLPDAGHSQNVEPQQPPRPSAPPLQPSQAVTPGRDYQFLVNGNIETGALTTNVLPALFPKMDTQIQSWMTRNPRWRHATAASLSRCVDVRMNRFSSSRAPPSSDVGEKYACSNCVRRNLLCTVIGTRGPIVVPLDPSLRAVNSTPTTVGFYVVE
ncbi:hypothetical protein ACMFMF_005586 [Clarireedia jacksonii]